MIGAFARGAWVLGEPGYARVASRAAQRVLGTLLPNGRLAQSLAGGVAAGGAFAEDYAFLTMGLLELFEATQQERWLRQAIALMDTLEREHLDSSAGGYYQSSDQHERLLAREKPGADGATPSANSVALLNQLQLAELTASEQWRRRAERTLHAFGRKLQQHPGAFSEMLLGVDLLLGPAQQIAIVVPASSESALVTARPLLEVLRRTFLPQRVLAVATEAEATARSELIPWLRGRRAQNGQATAYVCERGRCQLPTNDPAVFAQQLQQSVGRSGGRLPRE
jgi:uncharacterized protein YyaL (SSP411 family)